MKAKTNNKTVTFKTEEEYFVFYSMPANDKSSKGSKYYHMGEGIAKMVCDKTTFKMQDEVDVIDQRRRI